MSCACETIQLLSVVFFVVRAVHMKYIRIGDGLKEVYAVMEIPVHRRIYMLTSHHHIRGKCVLPWGCH